MGAAANPFTPIFGKDPAYFAGREQIISDMKRAFEAGGNDPNLSSIFVGARGTGKTALLSRLTTEAERNGWIAANVTSVPGMLDDIVQRIMEQAAHLVEPNPSRKLASIEVAPIGSITWESIPSEPPNWRSKMNALFNQLAPTGTGILITVDEVNPDLDEMVQLATTYQHFIREDKKVALLMAGLPHNVSALLSGESTSFLRRAFRYDLGSIPATDIEEAFRITLERSGKTIQDGALLEAVEATGGFPFMFQLVGYRMWNAADGSREITEQNVKSGVRLAQSDLRRQIIESTFNDLSKSDIAFLRAMLPDEKESATSEIAKRLDRPSGHVSSYKKRLLEAGVIEDGSRGTVRFSLPGFREYLIDND